MHERPSERPLSNELNQRFRPTPVTRPTEKRTVARRGNGTPDLSSHARTTCRPSQTPHLFGSEYEPTQSFSLTEPPESWPTKVTLPVIPWKRPVPLANSPDPLCAPVVLDCVPAI